MKVLIFGASGIVGQHMRLRIPEGVEPVWYRKTEDPITLGCDLESDIELVSALNRHMPDVVVNLAGESNVDVVEKNPARYWVINVASPRLIAEWCETHKRRYVHVSSQAVFSGDNPPYGPKSPRKPVNEYGKQKVAAEDAVYGMGAIIVRLSFVLGIRPLPNVGRRNPLEAMIAGQVTQVNDRWFSPLMAEDAAALLWSAAKNSQRGDILHGGISQSVSRYEIARELGFEAIAVEHESFPDIAPRPLDTRYAEPTFAPTSIHGPSPKDAPDRAVELALFFGISSGESWLKLSQGFGPLHNAVTEDFLAAPGGGNKTEAQLLEWYRSTEAYIWELSAYHEDAGFNYTGMCRGIVETLKQACPGGSVLSLGDGIGDMTLALYQAGFGAVYQDLAGSRTAAYAAFRFWRQAGQEIVTAVTDGGMTPEGLGGPDWEAIVSLDFLEHVPNVADWVRAVYAALKPGGLFFAQNAFACGSGPQGAMPMHLAVNDRFEQDWTPLMAETGFVQVEQSNWYRKPL